MNSERGRISIAHQLDAHTLVKAQATDRSNSPEQLVRGTVIFTFESPTVRLQYHRKDQSLVDAVLYFDRLFRGLGVQLQHCLLGDDGLLIRTGNSQTELIISLSDSEQEVTVDKAALIAANNIFARELWAVVQSVWGVSRASQSVRREYEKLLKDDRSALQDDASRPADSLQILVVPRDEATHSEVGQSQHEWMGDLNFVTADSTQVRPFYAGKIPLLPMLHRLQDVLAGFRAGERVFVLRDPYHEYTLLVQVGLRETRLLHNTHQWSLLVTTDALVQAVEGAVAQLRRLMPPVDGSVG